MYELYIILSIFTFLNTLGLVYDIFFKYFNQFIFRTGPFQTIYNACT